MNKFVADFGNSVKTSDIEKVGNLIDQLAEITKDMTDDELQTLDSCNVPHYIANLKYYNSICEKGGNLENKSYLDFFRDFLKSKEYAEFTAYKAIKDENGQKGSKSGSGGTQYSADSVDERQHIIDDFLDEFLEVNFKTSIAAIHDDKDITKSDTEISKAG